MSSHNEPTPIRRTDYCGELRAQDQQRQVTVCGWVARRREHGEHLAFVDLRDHTGVVQCVVDGAHDLRNEYVLAVAGTVRARPEGTVNPELGTGEIELVDCVVEVLATADPPPYQLDERVEVDETIRLRHRYVDLRTERMQANLRLRAKVNSALRRSMDSQGFIEVETPLLIASTPEGARDFIVPSRMSPGEFYALPQSPQLFKQLCMVGGIDRYYQIARCLRDEDLRADRQFEFAQLDMEASFTSPDEIRAVVSAAVADAVEAATGSRPPEPELISWHEAMDRYGSDKPDLRFGLELIDVTATFAETGFKAFQAPCIKAIRVPGGAETSRNRLEELTDQAKRWGAKGLVWMKVSDSEISSPVAKFLSQEEIASLKEATGAAAGDLLLLVADQWHLSCHVLGLIRSELGTPPITEGGLRFLWVVDFPMFERLDETGSPVPSHHPFTMPHPEDVEKLSSGDPEQLLSVRSQAYDLVLSGWELGSGSVRIHEPAMQALMFDVLGIEQQQAQEKFGFLLEAFRYGAPPHAGFAFGIDRLVALLAGEQNIREVIAFPKTQSGADPLTGAPGPVDGAHLAELGLRTEPRAQ